MHERGREPFMERVRQKLKRIHISTKTKMLILNLSGLTLSIAGLVFIALSAFFYNTSKNLSFDFITLAFTLMFIIIFIILPNSWNSDP
jgi:FtsH-binding integral membrane protein